MVRIIRKIRAYLNRTFVAHCPKCQKHFYGFHEYKTNVIVNNKTYRIVCHRCGGKGK